MTVTQDQTHLPQQCLPDIGPSGKGHTTGLIAALAAEGWRQPECPPQRLASKARPGQQWDRERLSQRMRKLRVNGRGAINMIGKREGTEGSVSQLPPVDS